MPRAWVAGYLLAGMQLASLHAQVSAPSTQPAPASASAPEAHAVDPLAADVRKAIEITARRQLTAGVHTPWQVVHGILALRHDFILKKPGGGTISGIDWMARGALHEGEPLWIATPHGGRGHPFTKAYAFEGHPTQFLGYMAMADLPLDFPLKAGGGKTITVQGVLDDAKATVHEGPEITWTLWALAHYLPPDAEWTNERGEPWSIERMVRIQTAESVLSGACGGTHGLFVLAYARNKSLAQGNTLRGVWIEADAKVKRFVAEARQLQNRDRDGSFSAAYFKNRAYSEQFTQRLPANGHTLEFLMMALSDRELQEEWVRAGVRSVARDLIEHRHVPSDCGPLYHALHALVLYDLRTNPNSRSTRHPVLARDPEETSAAQMPTDDANGRSAAADPAPAAPRPAVSARPMPPVPGLAR